MKKNLPSFRSCTTSIPWLKCVSIEELSDQWVGGQLDISIQLQDCTALLLILAISNNILYWLLIVF